MSNAPDKIWAVFEPHPNPKDKVPYVYACASQTKGKPYLLSTPAREHADELVEALEDAASAVEWCARRLDGPAQRILAEKWAEEYRSFVAKVRSGNDPSKIEQENTNE